MIEQINQMAEMWWSWMGPMLWQVSLLIVIIAGLDLVIRRWVWPQLRYALYLLILVKLVLPPTLALPTSITSNVQPLAEQTFTLTTEETTATTAQDSASHAPMTAPLSDRARLEGPVMEADGEKPLPMGVETQDLASVQEVGVTSSVRAVGKGPVISWKAYMMMVWGLGVAVLTGWLVARWNNLIRQSRLNEAEEVLPGWFGELLGATAGRLKVRRAPRVILSDKVCSPAVFGIWRPVLLMPADGIHDLSRQGAEHILLHELAHIKRGDLLVHGIYMMLQIVYWFNPLLWLVRRQMQHLRELCCDATVARVLREETPKYRETLLETARRLLAKPVEPGLGLLGLFEDSSRLAARLKWLEKKTWRHRPIRIAAILVVVILMAACILPMAKAREKASNDDIKSTADNNQFIGNSDESKNHEGAGKDDKQIVAKLYFQNVKPPGELFSVLAKIYKVRFEGVEKVEGMITLVSPEDKMVDVSGMLELLNQALQPQGLAARRDGEDDTKVQIVQQQQYRGSEDKEQPAGNYLELKTQYEQYFRNKIISILEVENALVQVDVKPLLDETEQIIISIPAGGITDITVTVLYPKSFFMQMTKQRTADKQAEPTDAEVQAQIDLEIPRLRKKVMAAIGLTTGIADNESKVLVGTYWDIGSVLAAAEPRYTEKGTLRQEVEDKEQSGMVIRSILLKGKDIISVARVLVELFDLTGKGENIYAIVPQVDRGIIIRSTEEITEVISQLFGVLTNPAPRESIPKAYGLHLPDEIEVEKLATLLNELWVLVGEDKANTRFTAKPEDHIIIIVSKEEFEVIFRFIKVLIDIPEMTARLPNGVEVEWLGFSEWVEGNLRWWGPEGNPTTIEGVYEADIDGLGTVLAFRIEPADIIFSTFTVRGPDRRSLKRKWRVNSSNIWLIPLEEERRYINLEFNITRYWPWESTGTIALSAEDFKRSPQKPAVAAKGGVIIQLVEDEDTYFTLNILERMYENTRSFVALGKQGQNLTAVTSRSRSAGGTEVRSPLNELAAVRWERRRFLTAPVKFRNISLMGGRKAEIQIEVGGEYYDKSYRQYLVWQSLHELGMALIRYSNNNTGFMPESLSAEKFGPYLSTAEESRYETMQYLGGGMDVKNLTTRPRMTPVAYDRAMLNDDWTVMLFADGHIEMLRWADLSRFGIFPDKIEVESELIFSQEKLKKVWSSVIMYCDDHEQMFPESLAAEDFKRYLFHDEQLFDWVMNNVEYLGKGKTFGEIKAVTPLAYDKAMLKQEQGTNIVFMNGRIEFVRREELKKYGIDPDKEP